jgi:hypothetical protein
MGVKNSITQIFTYHMVFHAQTQKHLITKINLIKKKTHNKREVVDKSRVSIYIYIFFFFSKQKY